MKHAIFFLLILLTEPLIAQEIAGKLLDEKREPMIAAQVVIYQNGVLKGGALTDDDGDYSIRPLDAGKYGVLAVHQGYDSVMITNVVVSAGNRTTQNFIMLKPKGNCNAEMIIKAYKKPLVDHDKPAAHVLRTEEILRLPDAKIPALAAGTPGIEAIVTPVYHQPTDIVYVVDCDPVRTLMPVPTSIQPALIGTPGHYVITKDDMGHSPYTNLEDILSTLPGVYQQRRGGDLHVYGSR